MGKRIPTKEINIIFGNIKNLQLELPIRMLRENEVRKIGCNSIIIDKITPRKTQEIKYMILLSS